MSIQIYIGQLEWLPLCNKANRTGTYVTSFITPWGQFQYLVAPMGLQHSGDSFTDRIDHLHKDTLHIEPIGDEALMFKTTIEAQFHQVCKALDLCSNNRVVFNLMMF